MEERDRKEAINEAIDKNPDAWKDLKEGQKGANNYLVGQVMMITNGEADPFKVHEDLEKIAGEDYLLVELESLAESETEEAIQLLMEVYDEHDADHCWYCGHEKEHAGPDSWIDFDARYHIWKGCDEFTTAKSMNKQGVYTEEEVLRRFRHGLNHIFMAMYVIKYTDIEK